MCVNVSVFATLLRYTLKALWKQLYYILLFLFPFLQLDFFKFSNVTCNRLSPIFQYRRPRYYFMIQIILQGLKSIEFVVSWILLSADLLSNLKGDVLASNINRLTWEGFVTKPIFALNLVLIYKIHKISRMFLWTVRNFDTSDGYFRIKVRGLFVGSRCTVARSVLFWKMWMRTIFEKYVDFQTTHLSKVLNITKFLLVQ